jgi:rhamnosyltransferase
MRVERVAVVIPTRNPGPGLRAIIDAVLGQRLDGPTTHGPLGIGALDVLVIDTASTDGTRAWIGAHPDPRLRLQTITVSEFGHGHTRNHAMALTTAPFVAFLTHDARPADHDWLRQLVAPALADPRVAGVFGRHCAHPGANPFTTLALERHFQGFADQAVVALDDPKRYAWDQGYRRQLHFFSNNNALLRRQVWEHIPFPDVDFAEDQAWAQAVIEAGHRKAYAAQALVYHSHELSLTETLQRSFDEADAFRRHFGYADGQSITDLLGQWLRETRFELGTARARGLWRSHPRAVVKRPAENLLRLAGQALGARGAQISPRLRGWLSWDARLRNAKRVGQRHGDA